MDPISNADSLVLLLRQKLRERSQAAAKGRTGTGQGAAGEPVRLSAVQQLAAAEGVDERQLRRALVQNLLAEHLGPSLLNDAQFQQVVSRVTGAIEEDAEASDLMARVLSELRTV
jgi:hypothetical protein